MKRVVYFLSFCGIAITTLAVGVACRDNSTSTTQPNKVTFDETTCKQTWEELLKRMKEGDSESARELLDRTYECTIGLPVELLERSEIALNLGRPELAYSDACRVVRMDSANGFGYSLIVRSVGQIQNPSQEQIDTANNATLILEALVASNAGGAVQNQQSPSESRGEDGP